MEKLVTALLCRPFLASSRRCRIWNFRQGIGKALRPTPSKHRLTCNSTAQLSMSPEWTILQFEFSYHGYGNYTKSMICALLLKRMNYRERCSESFVYFFCSVLPPICMQTRKCPSMNSHVYQAGSIPEYRNYLSRFKAIF